MATRTDDFLVIGGGIVGLTLARELKARHPDLGVAVLEKEEVCGRHASGRNSGVLHAGFYYPADSLKARFCREGNRELRAYCRRKDLPLEVCGKLVVARSEAEHAGLDELLRRARANGVEMEEVSPAEAREIEPRARTAGRALFSPTTAVVDPGRVMARLAADASGEGVEVLTGTAYQRRRSGNRLETNWGPVEAGYVVNAAGLHADRVARDFGFGEGYRILPFKGLYLRSSGPTRAFRTHVYPVPDLEKPFLGVHVTVTVHGHALLGPTAVPALWREQYDGLDGFRPLEALGILATEGRLFLTNAFGFRDLALEEIRKYRRPALVARAGELVSGLTPEEFQGRTLPGIRAQLLDLREDRLVMDFLHQGDDRSFHVLNAVSPGFTCALPFARHLADRVEALAG